MISRLAFQQLLAWKKLTHPKPLIIRGARQTGKTFLLREFGGEFANFIEFNFEENPKLKEIFENDFSAERIVQDIKLYTDQEIIAGKTLLFLDEVQEAPNAIKALRYFYENLPGLHVVAAGSLLDFALENVGAPVGRVDFLYLYPVSFLEFLLASNNINLAHEILLHNPVIPLNNAIHEKLLDLLATYLAVGGMPEAVQCWLDTRDLVLCNKICHSLIAAYRQDFQKYTKKLQIKYVDLLFNRVPLYQGKQFKYSTISQEYRKRELIPCLELLAKAQVINVVTHSSGNGVPLGAEIKPDKFKVIFLDMALSQTVLGLNAKDRLLSARQGFVNNGTLVEAFVGQELLAYSNNSIKANLYYWQRETRGSEAEVDYLIERGQQIIPVEVKSGVKGAGKSIRIFLEEKLSTPHGIKLSIQNYAAPPQISSSPSQVNTKTICPYPLYAIANIMGASIEMK